MEPSRFGPFLRQMRTERGLTQEQLAERMRVSAAAVSKWETGKCLPDLSKLEDLAELLDLSILELMNCARTDGPPPPPRQAMSQVFSETVKTVERRGRRRIAAAMSAALCAAALAVFLHYVPLHHVYKAWWPSYYDTGDISMLAYIGSREDRQAARPVMALAEQAFSDISLTREKARQTYGQLARYCLDREAYPDVASEEHTLRLWSARLGGGDGYLWVHYSQAGYDQDGETVTGSFDIPSLWRLEKDRSGRWVVVDVKEHP